MKKEFIIERQGKSFVLYAGLLEEAHSQGLKEITTTLIQLPSPDNGNVAVCQAVVETEKGRFSGIGDASPENVSPLMRPHLLRMAETRAKARALRDAVNVGVTALEEIAEEPESRTDASYQTPTITQTQAVNYKGDNRASEPPEGPYRKDSKGAGAPAVSERQLKAIYAIGQNDRGLTKGDLDEKAKDSFGGRRVSELSRRQASQFIDQLRQEAVH